MIHQARYGRDHHTGWKRARDLRFPVALHEQHMQPCPHRYASRVQRGTGEGMHYIAFIRVRRFFASEDVVYRIDRA